MDQMSRTSFPSRRRFLLGLAAPAALLVLRGRLGAAAGQGLGQFSVVTPGCKDDDKATPDTPEGPDYRPGSPVRSSLLDPSVTGTKLTFTGAVIGLTCGRVKGAVVDIWQADARGQYDPSGFRLRGRQLTDANGAFRFDTIVPGASNGRARTIHAKIQAPGKTVVTTQVFFPDDPANAHDPQFRRELVLTVMNDLDGRAGRSEKTASFNFILNI